MLKMSHNSKGDPVLIPASVASFLDGLRALCVKHRCALSPHAATEVFASFAGIKNASENAERVIMATGDALGIPEPHDGFTPICSCCGRRNPPTRSDGKVTTCCGIGKEPNGDGWGEVIYESIARMRREEPFEPQ